MSSCALLRSAPIHKSHLHPPPVILYHKILKNFSHLVLHTSACMCCVLKHLIAEFKVKF